MPGLQAEADLVARILPTISLDEVNEAVKNFLPGPGRLITVMVPQKEVSSVPSVTQLNQDVDKAMNDQSLKYVDQVSTGPLVTKAPQLG